MGAMEWSEHQSTARPVRPSPVSDGQQNEAAGQKSRATVDPKYVRPDHAHMKVSKSAVTWTSTSQDLQPHTPADHAVRAPSLHLEYGSSSLPVGKGLGYGAMPTTAGDILKVPGNKQPSSAFPDRAPNTALAPSKGLNEAGGGGVLPEGGLSFKTTSSDFKPYANSDIPQRAPGTALALGTKAVPFEGHYQEFPDK